MLLTPYAEQIRAEVHDLVTQASALFNRTAEVDPATLERTFTLQCNDVLAAALVPRLAARVATAAPGVGLRFVGEPGSDVDELRRGTVDLQLTGQADHPADVLTTTLLTDHVVTVARRDLPVDPASLAGFIALPHVVISRRGRTRNVLDEALIALGHERRVALTVPTVAVALESVAAADLLTAIPSVLTTCLEPALTAYPLPVATPPLPAVLAWHARNERDAAHRWLRTQIAETLTAAGEAPTAVVT